MKQEAFLICPTLSKHICKGLNEQQKEAVSVAKFDRILHNPKSSINGIELAFLRADSKTIILIARQSTINNIRKDCSKTPFCRRCLIASKALRNNLSHYFFLKHNVLHLPSPLQ